MTKIPSFKDFRIWQNAIDLSMQIFEMTQSFPPQEQESLTVQIRRSSRAVAANIAESWLKRRYTAAFIGKLNDAESETAQTQTWIEIAARCGYISAEEALNLDRRYQEILNQLLAIGSRPEVWTMNSVCSPLPLRPPSQPVTN